MTLSFNTAQSNRELIADALHWMQQGKRICLATLVNIEGSAPYPVGAQMLIDDRGVFLGQITGGCAEQAIADQAVAIIESNANQTHRYGLNSPYFDIQLPCGSGIDVYFDCQLSEQLLQRWLSQLDQGMPQQQTLHTGIGRYTKTYFPNPRLLLFGQGPILSHLAQLAIHSGFDVACIAQNDEALRRCQAHNLSAQLVADCRDFSRYITAFTGVVSLFHDHAFEDAILIEALQSMAPYIGALGSRKTHEQRCQSLLNKGVSQSELARIHGPIGVDIQASTPAQIAVSILAQAIQIMNQSISEFQQDCSSLKQANG